MIIIIITIFIIRNDFGSSQRVEEASMASTWEYICCMYCDHRVGPHFPHCCECERIVCRRCLELWDGNVWCYDCLDLFLEGGANGKETETEEDGAS